MFLGALAFDLAFPGSLWTWPAFLLSVFLGVVVSFAIRYLVAMSAFWLLDGAGAMQMAMLAGLFFSGMLLPLNLFPGCWARWRGRCRGPRSSRCQPMCSSASTPGELVGAYVFQAGWAVVLLGAGRLLQTAATRRVVVQGG